MNLFEMVRNGGIFAMAALAMGVVGVLIGAIGFAVRGVGIGVATALLGTVTAGLGIGGTLYGRHLTDQAIGAVNPVDAERIRPIGYREAQDAGWIGFGASLLPLLLGAAHVLRARGAVAAPVVASLTKPREESPAPIAGAALGFVAIGAMTAVGAFVLARAPLPVGPLGLQPDDEEGWELAYAIDRVKTEPWTGCTRLDAALEKYAGPVKGGTGWPREFAREPPKTLDWRPAANACIERWTGHGEKLPGDPGTEARLSLEAMMQSPMVHDTRLRGLVLQKQNEPNGALSDPLPPSPAPKPGEPVIGSTGSLAPAEIAGVVRKSVGQMKFCYEKELTQTPTLEGKLVVTFTIGPSGAVTDAVEKSDPPFPSRAVTDCVLGRVRKLKFPAHEGTAITVNYPFVFKSGG